MRLGTKTSNDFLQILHKKNEEIQNLYLYHLKNLTKTVSVKAMLGDSTISEKLTFDPEKIRIFYKNLIKNLQDWSVQDVSITNDEDIRRIFTKFQARERQNSGNGHGPVHDPTRRGRRRE